MIKDKSTTNTGICNRGNRNTGNYNTGSYNSGNYNSGNCNSGNCNSGNWNSGNWNSGNFSNGCFNTTSSKIYLFNKPSEWTCQDWLHSEARYLLNQIEGNILKYIYLSDMTEEEKEAHPETETTGGYLKKVGLKENAVIWWSKLTKEEKKVITEIPNFDKEIFKEIMGIDVDEE